MLTLRTIRPAVAIALLACFSPRSGRTVEPVPLEEAYRDAAGRLLGAALVSDRAYDTLARLCDGFGHRLSGSQALEAAIDWSAERMRAEGFSEVAREEVMVPVWLRGSESARLLAPAAHRLSILGLGRSVGTPAEGIEAEVVVVSTFAELDLLGKAGVEGKIVLFDAPFTSYGETVKYRADGASAAARYGAVAALVRSVGPSSYDTPHTGALNYAEDAPRIPAAAVTVENAAMLHRMAARGEHPIVHLEMGARTLPDAASANLVASVRGRELPDEVVVVGGHIDSWDVGQGAQDDGAGSVMAWEAARLILALDLKPRRSIRVVLFTNEENGLAGAKGYVARHAAELPQHVAAIEADSGSGPPIGFRFRIPWQPSEDKTEDTARQDQACVGERSRRAAAILASIATLLEPVAATKMSCGGSGADVDQMAQQGVVALGLSQDTTEYFRIHHTWADTVEKIDKATLDRNVAAMAILVYVLADMPDRL